MIQLTDINGRTHAIHPDAIARLVEPGSSGKWHGANCYVRTFDGDTIEVRENVFEVMGLIKSGRRPSAMPLDPNHIHADTPHAKTVHLASQGWRYGCHSARTVDDRPRGGKTRYLAHPWSGCGGRLIVTEWLPRSCCHSERATDAACEGCCNRGEE